MTQFFWQIRKKSITVSEIINGGTYPKYFHNFVEASPF